MSTAEYFSRKDIISIDVAEPDFGAQVGPQLLSVHHPDRCRGSHCCIHNPSEHHMKTWKQNWRSDKKMMERICSHGIGHPDPDDLRVKSSYYLEVHGCDGCCRAPK